MTIHTHKILTAGNKNGKDSVVVATTPTDSPAARNGARGFHFKFLGQLN